MHRLEWHWHFSGTSQNDIRSRSVCRKRDGKQCCLQFLAERREWLDFLDRSWKGIPGRRRSSRKRAITNGDSTCRWYECRRRSRPETTTSLYISRRLKCLSKVRWRSAVEATMRQNTQTKLYSQCHQLGHLGNFWTATETSPFSLRHVKRSCHRAPLHFLLWRHKSFCVLLPLSL